MIDTIKHARFVPHLGASLSIIGACVMVAGLLYVARPEPVVTAAVPCTLASTKAENDWARINLRCDVNGTMVDASLLTERARVLAWYVDNRDRALSCGLRENHRVASCSVP
jgi:hypothetical protein